MQELLAVVGLAVGPEARPGADVAQVVLEAPARDFNKVGLIPVERQ